MATSDQQFGGLQGSIGVDLTEIIHSPDFDLLSWYPAYQSCIRYFTNHAQYQGLVQTVASFVNIRLPYQWKHNPVAGVAIPGGALHGPPPYFAATVGAPFGNSSGSPANVHATYTTPFISLIPYVRRLIITGFDSEGVLHGFFGNDWQKGVQPLQEIERRNFLFAAKSVGWSRVKVQYDMLPDETVPFMKPLQPSSPQEMEKSEEAWSKWLAMEDWILGR